MKVVLSCWTCKKEHDATRWSNKYGVKCDCGGYIISPSGKIKPRYEGDATKPPEPLLKVL